MTKVVEDDRRVFSTLSKHREITLTPSVLQFIENKLREEVYNRRSEIVNFLQQRQMDTAEIDAQITKSVDEIFFSVIAFVVNESVTKLNQSDVEQGRECFLNYVFIRYRSGLEGKQKFLNRSFIIGLSLRTT